MKKNTIPVSLLWAAGTALECIHDGNRTAQAHIKFVAASLYSRKKSIAKMIGVALVLLLLVLYIQVMVSL